MKPFLDSVKSFLVRFVKKDFLSKLTAVFLALIIWTYVAVQQDTDNFQVIRDIPVVLRNLSEDYAVMNESDLYVSVRISGRRSVIKNIKTSDILVEADMNNRGEGVSTVPVIVTVPDTVTLASVQPATVEVKLDTVISKNFPIEVVTTGQVAQGTTMSTGYTVVPGEVVVTGPKSTIESIEKAAVYVNIEERDTSFTTTVPIQFYNKNDKLIEDAQLKYNPNFAEVQIVIGKTATLSVHPAIKGKPAEGYSIISATVEPATVGVIQTGRNGTVQNISTEEIDITDLNTSLEKTVKLNVPTGYELANKDNGNVTVKVVIDRIGTKEFRIDTGNISLIGINQNQLRFMDDTLTFTVKGAQTILDGITEESLAPTLDISDLPANTDGSSVYEKALKVTLPEGAEVVGGGPTVRFELTEENG